MSRAELAGFRSATPAVLLLGGGALAVATWAGGEHGFALALVGFYVIAAVIAYLWSGRDTDTAAVMRVAGDERQRRIDRDATAASGLAMGAAAIVGTVVQTTSGSHNAGPYAMIMAVGGFGYLLAFAYLRFRR